MSNTRRLKRALSALGARPAPRQKQAEKLFARSARFTTRFQSRGSGTKIRFVMSEIVAVRSPGVDAPACG